MPPDPDLLGWRSPMPEVLAWVLRRARAEIRHHLTSAGYQLRPYDLIADRRRWRWQPRTRCGWSHGIGRDHDA